MPKSSIAMPMPSLRQVVELVDAALDVLHDQAFGDLQSMPAAPPAPMIACFEGGDEIALAQRMGRRSRRLRRREPRLDPGW